VIGEKSVEGLEAGVYHYRPVKHGIEKAAGGDMRDDLAAAALGQAWMAEASVIMVITAEYARVCSKYGDRGRRYAVIEAGHVGQNIFLQAEAMDLAAGIVGAFRDQVVIDTMKIPESHEPLLIMPVGYPG
jgi:SagB-type dehydrogenase family enzyme